MFKKVVSIFSFCCLVFVVGCGDTSMFNIKKVFENKFELEYPKSDAELFATEPAVRSRLDSISSVWRKSVLETKKFQEKISALPATTQNEITTRLNGFNEYKDMIKHDEQLKQEFKNAVEIVSCAGYKNLAKTYVYEGDGYWYDVYGDGNL